MSAPSRSEMVVAHGQHAELIAARLAYVERHGARFLFANAPPPAPGWPVLRKGKVVTA